MPDGSPTGIAPNVDAAPGVGSGVAGESGVAGWPHGEAYYQVLVLFDAATAQALTEPYQRLYSQIPAGAGAVAVPARAGGAAGARNRCAGVDAGASRRAAVPPGG